MMDTGRIHIYFGDGKGKTTAAVGQAVRAAGHGFRVLFFQFLKDNSSNERKILEQISNITCLPGREQVKFVSRMNGDEKAELLHYNNKALDEIVKFCSPFDLLVMDEALCAGGTKGIERGERQVWLALQHRHAGAENRADRASGI
ncbi:MAG: cob(I)yrinic acid a,c-diamide adenosyltransferase [[Clostridium] scindens]